MLNLCSVVVPCTHGAIKSSMLNYGILMVVELSALLIDVDVAWAL